MRLSPAHVDYIAFLVYRELKDNKRVVLKNADLVAGIVRARLLENLRAEGELEKEAERLLEPHRQRILAEGGDYARMIRDGMKKLARQKGIPL